MTRSTQKKEKKTVSGTTVMWAALLRQWWQLCRIACQQCCLFFVWIFHITLLANCITLPMLQTDPATLVSVVQSSPVSLKYFSF